MQVDNTSQPRHHWDSERRSQGLRENILLFRVKLKHKNFLVGQTIERVFCKRRYIDGKYTHENMTMTTGYQENASSAHGVVERDGHSTCWWACGGDETLGFWWEWKGEHTLQDPPSGEEGTRAFRDQHVSVRSSFVCHSPNSKQPAPSPLCAQVNKLCGYLYKRTKQKSFWHNEIRKFQTAHWDASVVTRFLLLAYGFFFNWALIVCFRDFIYFVSITAFTLLNHAW